MAQFNNTIYSNEILLVDYLRENALGKTFKVKLSHEYKHGKIVKEKVLKVIDGVRDIWTASVEKLCTFSDGYTAEYICTAHGFYADHYQDF